LGQIEVMCVSRAQQGADSRFSTVARAGIFGHNAVRMMIAVVDSLECDTVRLEALFQALMDSLQRSQRCLTLGIAWLVGDQEQGPAAKQLERVYCIRFEREIVGHTG